MNPDEKTAYRYLQNIYGVEPVFEPNGNRSPDFLISGKLAVEVRRLNANAFHSTKPEGLENLSRAIQAVMQEIIPQFDMLYQGRSFWVDVRYKRPIRIDYKKLKAIIAKKLDGFLQQDVETLPTVIEADSTVKIIVDRSVPIDGRVFRYAGWIDRDQNDWPISAYIQNITYCIREKSGKIAPYLDGYGKWQLILIDHISNHLTIDEWKTVEQHLGGLGNFSAVLVLDKNAEIVVKFNPT